MLKFFRNHFGMVVSIIIALILSLCMSATATVKTALMAGTAVQAETLVRNWGTAFLVIMLISVFLPVKMWGDQFAAAVKLRHNTLPFGLVSNLIPTLFYNTGATLVLVGVNVGFSAPYYWAAVAGDYLLMFVISYVLSLVAERLGMVIAQKACLPTGGVHL
ncbi:MAG: hypothetical protein ACI4MK_08215 [Aristaeellaceae bacterium]